MEGFGEKMKVFREEKGILESKGQTKEVFRTVRGKGKREGNKSYRKGSAQGYN